MDQCWIWRGGKNSNGYGHLRWRGKTAYAHRAVWEMAHGPIPDGQYVCHRCDNPMCVNPAHLFLGSAADNARDMVEKGRSARSETHSQSVLTAGMVEDMRAAYRAGGVSHRELARRYGVRHQTVSSAIRGQSWKYLPGAVTEDCRHFTPQARAARRAGPSNHVDRRP